MGMAPLGLLSPLNHQFLVVQPVLSMEIKFPIRVSETTGVAHPIELGTYDAPEGMITLRVVAVEGVDKNRAGAGPFGLDCVVPMQPRAVPD